MSIPLDRLYHFLEDQIKDDIIIYRWYPHGSKKIEHLSPLHSDVVPYLASMTFPGVIMHDQEPLNFDLYPTCNGAAPTPLAKNPLVMPLIASMPAFRQISCHPFNINDKIILVHSEQNSSQLDLYVKHNYVPVYYWSHAIIARDWFRYAQHDAQLDFSCSTFHREFLIYNRAWSGTREYRLKFCEQLVENNLLDRCQITFSEYDEGEHYLNYKFANPSFVTTTRFHELMPANNASSSASADYCSADYQSCAIEVILETLFDDTRNHCTEKTLRAMACGKPFIVMGTPGTLQYLKSYGFETFSGLIDETYDGVLNPVTRLQHVVQEMKRIAALPAQQKFNLYTELHLIAQRNKQRFFSSDFFDQVINEFKYNIKNAIDTVKADRNSSWLKLFWALLDQQPELRHQLAKKTTATPEDFSTIRHLVESGH